MTAFTIGFPIGIHRTLFFDIGKFEKQQEKPGGRAGLRKFACALHVASSVVCALRALFKNDFIDFYKR